MTIAITPLKPDLFAIRFHARRWLKTVPYKLGRERAHGWRPVVWTDDFTEAEKFETHGAALAFAQANIVGLRQIPV